MLCGVTSTTGAINKAEATDSETVGVHDVDWDPRES
jgi:hypothetical protein